MSDTIEVLNTAAHGEVCIRSDFGEPHPHFVLTVINEFPTASSICPIFFSKNATTGAFYAGALFGFEAGELLVDGAAENRAVFEPLALQRMGFFTYGEDMAIDIAHPRFGAGASIALFDDDGSPSSALKKIQRALAMLTAGTAATQDFIQEMLRLKLIEPIDVALQFDDGRRLALDGLYTISRDALSDLPDHEVTKLFRSGYLQAALCVTFSLNQIAVLARRRNERLTE